MASSSDISNAFIGASTVPKQGMRDHITLVKTLWAQQEGYKQWRLVQQQIMGASTTPQIVFAIPTSPTPAELMFQFKAQPVTNGVDLLMRLDNGSGGGVPVTGSAVGQQIAAAGITAFANSNSDCTLTSGQVNTAAAPAHGHVSLDYKGNTAYYNMVFANATGLIQRTGAYCVTGAAFLVSAVNITFLWSGAGNFLVGTRIALFTRDQ